MQSKSLLSVILIALVIVAHTQRVQSAPMGESVAPPPVHAIVDKYGIDLLSWQPGIGGMTVSIGAEGSGIASLPGRQRYTNDNHTGTLTHITVYSNAVKNPELVGVPAGSYLKVDILGQSELFSISGGTYTNYKQTGGTLSCTSTTCTYINKQGATALFDFNLASGFAAAMPCGCFGLNSAGEKIPPYTGGYQSFYKSIAQVKTVTHPNGEVITYSYISIPNYSANMINSVSSSLGWMLKYYFSDKVDSWTNNTVLNVQSDRSIKAINTSIEYCDTTSRSCSTTQNSWPTSTMTGSSSISFGDSVPVMPGDNYNPAVSTRSTGSTVTDSLGFSDSYSHSEGPQGSTNFYTSPGGILHKYYIPGMAYFNGSFSETTLTGRVRQVSIGNSYFFDYFYDTKVTPEGTFITDAGRRYLQSYKDNLNRQQNYTYADAWGYKADKLINPDATPNIDAATGGYIDYDYDSRGNIIAVTTLPKTSGTPVVISATYPATCSNIKTCNKPDTITEQNGVTTTYAYHAQSGYVETITKPAVNGVQAQTRYKYEQKTPYIKNSSGSLIASSQLWVLTEISECMTQTLNTCVGTTDEKRTVYSDFTNNLLPQKMTVQNGDGSARLDIIKEYDIYGNVISIDGPRTGTADRTYYFYDSMRQKIGEIGVDPDGAGPLLRKAIKTAYNGDGKVVSIETGLTSGTTKTDLDAIVVKQKTATEYSTVHGLPIVERFYAAGLLERVIQKSYNSELLLDCVAQRLNRDAWLSLPQSACTLSTAGSEGNDRITKYNYDLTGAVLSVISGYGTALQRADRTNTYDATNGLLTTAADGKGNTTFYKFDNFNRPFKTVFPISTNGAVESTTDYTQTNYKTGSSLVDSVRLRDGLVINFSEYDSLGRAKTKSGALSETFTYNNFNQIVTHTNNSTGGVSQTSSYVYNSLGWLKSESRVAGGVSLGSVSYGHDTFGRRTSLTWPDNVSVLYDYNVSGSESEYLRKITESNGTVLATFDYYDNGRRKTLTRGNGVVTTYGYNDLDQLTNQSTDVGGTIIADDITEIFQYNISGQLKTHALTAENNNYIYVPQAISTTNYIPDTLNRIASVNGVSFGYDGRGNLTSDNNDTSYSYNANNLLLNATKGGVTTTLNYDAENRLHSLSKSGNTTKFVYDGTDLIAETDSSNNILRRYVHGPEIDDPIVWYEGSGTADKRYYTANRQGSIVGITLQNGMSTSVNAYDEYGVQKLNTIGRFQFTGQAWIPELGLYYYKARLYNPSLGRFMQTDPIGYKDGMNWYAYVGNDPVNKSDSTGMYKCDGTREQCAQLKNDLKVVNEALKSGKLNKEQTAKVTAVNKTLGKEGERNGVTISFGALKSGGRAEFGGPGKDADSSRGIIRVDRSKMRDELAAGSAVAHEVDHIHTFEKRGKKAAASRAEALEDEKSAYGVNAAIYQGHGYTTSDKSIEKFANQSVDDWCRRSSNTPGC